MINISRYDFYLIKILFLISLLVFNPIYVTAFFGLLFIFLPINFGEIFSKSILNIFFISLAFFAFMFSREYGVYWFSPFSTAHDDIVSYIAILDNPRDIRGSDLMQPIWLIFQFLYGYIGFSGYNLLIFSFLSIFAVMYSISRISLNINLTIFVTIAIFWGFWDVFGHLYRVTLALPFLIVLMTQSILYDQLKLRWVMISSAIHLSYYFFFTRLIFRKNDLISLVLALIAPAILLLLAFNFFAFFLGERSTLYSPNEATSFRISYIHFYIALTAIFFSFYANNSWRYWFFLSVAGFIISIFGFEVIAERSVLLFTLISSFALNSYLTFMSLKVKLIYFWFATIYFTYRAIKYDQHEGYESIFEYFSYSEPFNLFSGILYNFIKMALL